ncbi:MAG: hypothetical protein KBA51_06625 [Kiritimatiellae bacterium]|nr:hypothetical protein [Kiritimatiellia bacterium]
MSSRTETGAHEKPGARNAGWVSLRRVRIGLLAFYLLVFALNAASLHRNNEHMPFGPLRTFWISISRPFARACVVLGLDRPRDWVSRTAGSALND